MSKPIIHTPHDLFFKHSVDDVSVAKSFFQAHLPASLQQRIHWDTLRLTNKSFSDEQLQALHSDVVYSCQLDQKRAYIYLLIEQQTDPDPLLPFPSFGLSAGADVVRPGGVEPLRPRLIASLVDALCCLSMCLRTAASK